MKNRLILQHNQKQEIMEQEIKFCGNAILNEDLGMVKISINLNQLHDFLTQNKEAEKAGKEGSPAVVRGKVNSYLKLVAFPLKQPQEYATHFVKIDEWKPDSNYKREDTEYTKKGYNWTADEKPIQKKAATPIEDTDLPF